MEEELFDRIGECERRLDALEEEFQALLRVLEYAESLDVVHGAATSALEALKEVDNWRFVAFEPDFELERKLNPEDDGA